LSIKAGNLLGDCRERTRLVAETLPGTGPTYKETAFVSTNQSKLKAIKNGLSPLINGI